MKKGAVAVVTKKCVFVCIGGVIYWGEKGRGV